MAVALIGIALIGIALIGMPGGPEILIIALVLLNIEEWFRDPLSLHQLASWFLLAATVVPGMPGVYLLVKRGKPESHCRDDESLIGVEKTTQLVTTGVFKYIRHPLYCSLLLLAWTSPMPPQ